VVVDDDGVRAVVEVLEGDVVEFLEGRADGSDVVVGAEPLADQQVRPPLGAEHRLRLEPALEGGVEAHQEGGALLEVVVHDRRHLVDGQVDGVGVGVGVGGGRQPLLEEPPALAAVAQEDGAGGVVEGVGEIDALPGEVERAAPGEGEEVEVRDDGVPVDERLFGHDDAPGQALVLERRLDAAQKGPPQRAEGGHAQDLDVAPVHLSFPDLARLDRDVFVDDELLAGGAAVREEGEGREEDALPDVVVVHVLDEGERLGPDAVLRVEGLDVLVVAGNRGAQQKARGRKRETPANKAQTRDASEQGANKRRQRTTHPSMESQLTLLAMPLCLPLVRAMTRPTKSGQLSSPTPAAMRECPRMKAMLSAASDWTMTRPPAGRACG
jgi:hypothetical protein